MWMFPIIVLRGLLIGIVLLPFVETLGRMRSVKRMATLFALSYLLLHLAAAAPSPGNLEGFVYMKQDLVTVQSFFATQPEMLLQSGLFAVGVSWVLTKIHRKQVST